MSALPAKSEFLIYKSNTGAIKLEVRFDHQTVWLTQQQLAELFQTTVPNISMHLRNVFAEGELRPEATVQRFLTVRQEGLRQVRRKLEHYNLDAIISVGYRITSSVATQFPMRMGDWVAKLDGFLRLNERDILTHAGRVTHDEAVGRATEEYDAFHREHLAEKAAQADDFDQAIRALPAARPAGKKKRGTP